MDIIDEIPEEIDYMLMYREKNGKIHNIFWIEGNVIHSVKMPLYSIFLPEGTMAVLKNFKKFGRATLLFMHCSPITRVLNKNVRTIFAYFTYQKVYDVLSIQASQMPGCTYFSIWNNEILILPERILFEGGAVPIYADKIHLVTVIWPENARDIERKDKYKTVLVFDATLSADILKKLMLFAFQINYLGENEIKKRWHEIYKTLPR